MDCLFSELSEWDVAIATCRVNEAMPANKQRPYRCPLLSDLLKYEIGKLCES